MALDPKNIAVQVALRTQQLDGTDQSTLDQAYLVGYTALDGAEIPALALIDAVVASEGRLADLVGGDRQNPYRASLYARSDDLATKSRIPIIAKGGLPFVGIFSQVVDSDNEHPLTEFSIQEYDRWVDGKADGSYTYEYFKYVQTASRLYHTRPLAYVEGCAWSRDLAIARMDVDSIELSPLPQVFESIWVAETISYLVMEGWLAGEAGYYLQFAQQGLAMIRSRGANMPSLQPFQATTNPVSN